MLYKEIKKQHLSSVCFWSLNRKLDMANIEDQKYFLQLLVYGNNHKKVLATLKEINDIQYTLLKNIANDILDEIIPLNTK